MAQLLLVEDDPAIRHSLVRALSERGHAVASSTTAMDALQHVVAAPPDLVILDLGLPGLDGYEALRMLRAISRVPVVVATGRLSPQKGYDLLLRAHAEVVGRFPHRVLILHDGPERAALGPVDGPQQVQQRFDPLGSPLRALPSFVCSR